MWDYHYDEVYADPETRLAVHPQGEHELAVMYLIGLEHKSLQHRVELLRKSFNSYIYALKQDNPALSQIRVESRLLKELEDVIQTQIVDMDRYYEQFGQGIQRPYSRDYYLLCSHEELEAKFERLESLLFTQTLADNPLDLYIPEREFYSIPRETPEGLLEIEWLNQDIQKIREKVELQRLQAKLGN